MGVTGLSAGSLHMQLNLTLLYYPLKIKPPHPEEICTLLNCYPHTIPFLPYIYIFFFLLNFSPMEENFHDKKF